MIRYLLFHLFCQKRRRHCCGLFLRGIRLCRPVLGQKAHGTGHIPRRDDGADAEQSALRPLAGQEGLFRVAAAGVELPAVHQLFQRLADAAVHKVPPPGTGRRQDAVPVTDEGRQCEALAQRIHILRRHAAQLPHRRILLEDDLAVAGREDLQRVSPADALGAADLLGDDDPPQLIPSCQSKSKNKFPSPETRINTGFFEFPRTKTTAYPL